MKKAKYMIEQTSHHNRPYEVYISRRFRWALIGRYETMEDAIKIIKHLTKPALFFDADGELLNGVLFKELDNE